MNVKETTLNFGDISFSVFDIETSLIPQYLQDEYDKNLYNLEGVILPENGIVVDIGANVGGISFYFAKKYPDCVIYAYEPHPVNYANLLKGIEKNGFTNIKPFNLAVFDEAEVEMEIYLDPENSGASSLFYPNENAASIETTTLDLIIKQNNLEHIDYLKLDCEGSEFEIMETSNALNHGTIRVENMFTEIHKFRQVEGDKNIIALLERIKRFPNVGGFMFFVI